MPEGMPRSDNSCSVRPGCWFCPSRRRRPRARSPERLRLVAALLLVASDLENGFRLQKCRKTHDSVITELRLLAQPEARLSTSDERIRYWKRWASSPDRSYHFSQAGQGALSNLPCQGPG